MKRAWIWIALGLSLGINVGVLGTVWFHRAREAVPQTNVEPLFADGLSEPLEPAEPLPGSGDDSPHPVEAAVAETPEEAEPPRPAPVEIPREPVEPAPRELAARPSDTAPPPADSAADRSAVSPQAESESNEVPGDDHAVPLPSPAEAEARPGGRSAAQRLIQRLELDPAQARDFLRIQRDFFRETRLRLARIEALQRELRYELTRRRPDQRKIDRTLGQLGRAHAELETTFSDSVLRSRQVLDERQERLYLAFLSQVRARALGRGSRIEPGQPQRRPGGRRSPPGRRR